MIDPEISYFRLLKKEIADTLSKSCSLSHPSIEEWKGQDIVNFQEDLAQKVNGRISEKWFYTHMKSANDKLPRIDMLNMLSQYAGYESWAAFREQHGGKDGAMENKSTRGKKIFLGAVGVLCIVLGIYMLDPGKSTYRFCFVDAYRKTPITGVPIDIIILRKGESPAYASCDSSGCFEIDYAGSQLQFIVRSPYYKTDTITRITYDEEQAEMVELKTNDYALMIHLFSTSKIEDWKKRRAQMDEMIAEDAQIYQIFDNSYTGMELYNKQEFINKMTMPLKSLKNIEIIETVYKGQQISIMRFRQLERKGVAENE